MRCHLTSVHIHPLSSLSDPTPQAWEILEEHGSEAIHPGLQMLYSIQKNLATMSTNRKDYSSALQSYLEVNNGTSIRNQNKYYLIRYRKIISKGRIQKKNRILPYVM